MHLFIRAVLTAIFATCGMGGWEFLIGALLSSPKQLATVYLGVAQSNTSALAGAKAGIIVGLTSISYIALWYIGRKIDQVKVKVIYERRKRRCVPCYRVVPESCI